MPSKCKQCGESAVDDDERVCTSCGVVIEDIDFGSDPSIRSSENKLNFQPYREKKLPLGLRQGVALLESLKSIYNFTTDIRMEAEYILKSIYKTRTFGSKEDVMTLAGCCVVYLMNKRGQYLSMNHIIARLGCRKKTAFKFYAVVKKFCAKSAENPPNSCVEDEDDPYRKDDKIDPLLSGTQLPDCLVSMVHSVLVRVDDTKNPVLINKTLALTKLSYSCWLMTGRSIESGIMAAAYLCFVSMDPNRRKLTFKKFCTDFSLPYKIAHYRVTELKQMLVKLGSKIPAISENYVTEKNVLFHLNYILENSETLRNDLLENQFSPEDINKTEFSIFRKPVPIKPKALQTISQSYDSDMCASDIEISDSEISSYIRSDEQIEIVNHIRNMNEGSLE